MKVWVVIDYFSDEPRFLADYFWRRFCMSERLFLRMSTHCPLWRILPITVRCNRRQSLSSMHKCLLPSDNLLPGNRGCFRQVFACGEFTGILCYASKCCAPPLVLLLARNSFGHPPLKITNWCFIFTKQTTYFPAWLKSLTACIGSGIIARLLRGGNT